MTNWRDIHVDFIYYQQWWEQNDITKEEAEVWIVAGFEPDGLDQVKQWKNLNFSPTETKTWLEVGLSKHWDLEFASWLRVNNHIPELVKNNLEQLRSDYENFRVNKSQIWLEQVYPNHNIKELDVSGKGLKGELNFSQYQQLESLNCWDNKLTKIILPTSLKELNLRSNNFPKQDLSFLVPCINLEELKLERNKFTGSLDYLSGLEQLKGLDISNTDINEVNIDKLPKSLKEIWYSTEHKPNCKLKTIVPQLEKYFGKHGRCLKCYKPNTSENWCQFCAEQEWKKLTGQELINKFIEQQGKDQWGKDKLKWIPCKEFTDIKYLAEGGFSKIYKAKWEKSPWGSGYDVVLKSLINSNPLSKELGVHSQNITWEFLNEINNTRLVEGGSVVKCHGISQNPTTKNYLMVMDYKEDGNLRQYLQNNKLSFWNKLERLKHIANGLNVIHLQNLVHQDFHSGNILNESNSSYITDLGLSGLVNHLKQEDEIFGVLPYVAPEVLRGQPYTKKTDIYSFGIVMYELLARAYPYPEIDYLGLRVCQGLRPNLDKVPLPQLLKDLIKRCWDINPDKRPEAKELKKIISNWESEIGNKVNSPFYLQYKEIEEEYNIFSQKPYQIYGSAITTSKSINTKEINKLSQKNEEISEPVEFNIDELDNCLEELQIQTHQEISPK